MMKRIRHLAQALAIGMIIGAVGCSAGTKSGVTVSIPLDPQQSSITGLKGQVRVSGMSGIFAMTISGSTASVNIPEVPEGSRTFTVTFFVGPVSTPIIVAEVTVTRNVSADVDLQITYAATDFDYDYDDDADSFTNYSEITSGSDPEDASSYPSAIVTADAGTDQTTSVGTSVTLDGSGTQICAGIDCIYLVDYPTDPDVIITWAWSFTSVPLGSYAYLEYPNTSMASFTPDVAGTYEIQLTAKFCVGTDCLLNDDSVSITASTSGGTGTPPAPTNLTAVSESGPAANLAWTDNSTNETGFKLEWSSDGATWYSLTSVGASVTQYTDTVVVVGNTYYYRVYAYNSYGNSTYSNTAQVTVTSAGSAWTASFLGAGGYHACAVTDSGGVKCWGVNGNGQLGNGSTTGPGTCTYYDTASTETTTLACGMTPVDVSSLSSGVAKVVSGGYFSCALTTAGGVKCWGSNLYGQLGNGSTTASSVPVNVSGLTSGVTALSAGMNHVCALMSAGGVKCWGNNEYGKLGDGSSTGPQTCNDGTNNVACSQTPVNVSGLTGAVTVVSAGLEFTCGLISGGTIECWGRNTWGSLGDGSTTDSTYPVSVIEIVSGATALSSSPNGYFSCAVVSGAAKCWGSNDYDSLGVSNSTTEYCNGSDPCSKIPINVTGLTTGVTGLSAGTYHACALVTGGGVKCWGYNSDGELGNGGTIDSYTPVNAVGLTSGAAQISMGFFFSCARTTMSALKCWGNNFWGQIGDGTTNQRTTPTDVDMIP